MKRDDLNKNYENKNSTKQVCDIDPNYYKIITEEYVAIYYYRSIIDESQMHYNGNIEDIDDIEDLDELEEV